MKVLDRERRQFGKRIGDFQLIQAMLADSQAELYAGWSMVQDCALRYDAKGAPSVSDPHVSMLASCCKLFCTEIVGRWPTPMPGHIPDTAIALLRHGLQA